MIKGILLEIDGKEIEMTVEQAKALHGSLDAVFGAKKIEYVPCYVPNYIPTQPYVYRYVPNYIPTQPYVYPNTWYSTSGYITTATST